MNRGKILNFVLKSNFLFFCTSSQVFKSNFNQVVSRFDFKNIIQIANGKGSTLLILTVKELIVFDVMLELIVSRLQLELPFISMEYSEKLYLCTLLQVHVAVDLNQPYSTDLKLETRLVWESKMEIKSLKLSFNSIYLQHLKMVTVFDISTRKMDLISHSDLVTAMTIINGYSGHIRSQGGQSDESASGDGYSREKENLILGDERGCISILHGRKRVRLHWHANPVGALACTNDGSYLLSGGQESTLVMWQLQTGFKQFLPRLGGFILDIQISSDDLHYVLYLSDNSLLIIDAVDTNIRHSIQNTEACMVDISEYPMSIGLQQDHFKNYCVNGSASRLQLFDSKSLEPVQTMDLGTRNVVTTNRKTMRQNHVTNCCFGNTGSEGDANSFWMVTSDENNEFGDQYLRFWIYNAEARQYEQHTRIEKSHKTRITSISLCSNYLVSCGDTSAKIWAYDQDGCWGLCDTFSYKGYTANKCAWLGHGGEYLTVAFGAVLTVWNVLEGCLITTLSFGYSSDIKNVAFVGDEYLVASDNNLFQVWNWKQKTVVWSMVIKVTQLCVCRSRFAVATRGSRIFTFEVESPEPLSTIQNENVCFGMVLHEEELVIWDGSFAIKKYRGNRLVPVDHAASTASQLIEDRDNNFSSIYSNTGYEKRDNQEFHVQRIGNQELFNGPSHVLPKPSLIVGKFLKGLLSVRTKTITPTQNVEMQVDHDSEPIVEKWKPKKDVGPLDLDFLDSYFAQTVI